MPSSKDSVGAVPELRRLESRFDWGAHRKAKRIKQDSRLCSTPLGNALFHAPRFNIRRPWCRSSDALIGFYSVSHRNLASRHSSRMAAKWKNLQGARTTLINIPSDNISLVSTIQTYGSFFTSSDINIVRQGAQDSWTKDQLPSISTGKA
jgi:hypothetical protein